MPVFTSTHFASASASGKDWRDTSKKVLEKLESVRTESDSYNFGFIYITDELADDASSIYNLFRSVLKINNWVGSIGMGIVGCHESLINKPSISVMIGSFPEGSFRVFPESENDDDAIENSKPNNIPNDAVEQWLIENTPLLGVVHADPLSEDNQQDALKELETNTNSFLVGGMTSSRSLHFQIANGVFSNTLNGAFFADTVPVSTTLSQGCRPFEAVHTITKSDENIILELDDRRALDVLQEDLKDLASAKMQKSIGEFGGSFTTIESSDRIPEEFKTLFQGQVHAALSLSQSDQKDFLVRNISAMDPDEGSFSISESISNGDSLFFVERNQDSITSDLSKTLINLRKRVTAERGCFEPKGALYISCIARGFSDDEAAVENEMALLRDIIGEIPMTGFYAGGEINNARLYSYTGILTLFF
ncbi:MAG: FIST signal transduction protein [Alcanivorax sp.]